MLGESDGTCDVLGAIDSTGGTVAVAALRLLTLIPPATEAAITSISMDAKTALTVVL
jgi:hypothetical protein